MKKIATYLIDLALIVGLTSFPVQYARTAPYGLDAAFDKGIVEWLYNPWQTRDVGPLLSTLDELDPGIVYRVGFLYGGPNQEFLSRAKGLVEQIHRKLPQSLIGATLPEVVSKVVIDAVDLSCENAQAPTHFGFASMTLAAGAGAYEGFSWIDLAQPEAQNYYVCLGKIFIDSGFSILEFQNVSGILEHTPVIRRTAAIQGLMRVERALKQHAGRRPLYLAGDASLSKIINTAIVYNPARFYHTDAWGTKYQNRISRRMPGPGMKPLGVGYSYALSQSMIDETKKQSRAGVKIVFNVDNFDQTQDDLRRLMELDAENRRFLITESSRIARLNGVYFAPPILHCEGCVDGNNVAATEQCMLVKGADGTPKLNAQGKQITSYDAHECGDYEAIRDALHRKPLPQKKAARNTTPQQRPTHQ